MPTAGGLGAVIALPLQVAGPGEQRQGLDRPGGSSAQVCQEQGNLLITINCGGHIGKLRKGHANESDKNLKKLKRFLFL